MNSTHIARLVVVVISVLICGACFAAAPVSRPSSQSKSTARQQNDPLNKAVSDQLATAYKNAASGQFDQAAAQADEAMEWLIASGAAPDDDAFRDVAFARRLLTQLKHVEEPARSSLYQYLRKNDAVAKAIAFGLADGKDGADAYKLLDRLRKAYPDGVAQFPNLAAAISLTHGQPIDLQLNENHAQSKDPLALFQYFSSNEKRMFFGLRNVPVELLVYVVDTTASIDELNWAASRYSGRPNIGEIYFNVPYDIQNFNRGTAKAITSAGYTLPNLLRYGGVCIDQAYFAAEVGKAVGVPTAIVTGTSSEDAHAWVGFFQYNGKNALWNFDSGRYANFQHVRGNVRDPQTGDTVPDGYVAIQAETIGIDPLERQTAAAYVDAAKMIIQLGRVPSALPPGISPGRVEPPSASTSPVALDLIETGLRHNVAYLPGWNAVAQLAGKNQLTLEQKRRWSDLIEQLCGKKYPDFALAVLVPMIESVEDVPTQARMWESTFNAFLARPDLAAELRMAEGRMFEKNGDYAKAGQCYTDVIRRFINSTSVAMAAVLRAEIMLRKMDQDAKVLDLYKWASSIAVPPASGRGTVFEKESNWYKLHAAYEHKLAMANGGSRSRTQ